MVRVSIGQVVAQKEQEREGKPSVADVCRFLTLPTGDTGGWLKCDVMKANIMEKLIGDLPDSSAAASAPVIGFVVALFFVQLLHFTMEWVII